MITKLVFLSLPLRIAWAGILYAVWLAFTCKICFVRRIDCVGDVFLLAFMFSHVSSVQTLLKWKIAFHLYPNEAISYLGKICMFFFYSSFKRPTLVKALEDWEIVCCATICVTGYAYTHTFVCLDACKQRKMSGRRATRYLLEKLFQVTLCSLRANGVESLERKSFAAAARRIDNASTEQTYTPTRSTTFVHLTKRYLLPYSIPGRDKVWRLAALKFDFKQADWMRSRGVHTY